MTHLDLFSGIGGFALAADRVWENVEHIFVEYDPFCQEVLKKHWPEAEIHGDIREFVADAKFKRPVQREHEEQSRPQKGIFEGHKWPFILTGGFPCQPFSQAGRRKGTNDDRYLWPPMFEAISIFKPQWVIAENVAGLVTWDNGVVLEQVCTDLESEGYEVQPFIVPACAINAPHRRDRVWIVAYTEHERKGDTQRGGNDKGVSVGTARPDTDAPHSQSSKRKSERRATRDGRGESRRSDWSEDWLEVATRLCRVDDGVPKRLDRNPRLKALGNALVPQVAEEIMRRMITTT